MLNPFNKEPLDVTFLIGVIGEFAPRIFHPQWFAKQNLISETKAEANKPVMFKNDVSIVEFDFCKFEARQQVIKVETDQLAFIVEMLDLLSGTLSSLKNIPVKGFDAHVYTHYNVGSAPDFIKNLSKGNNFWNDTVGEYEYSEIEIVIPKPSGSKGKTRLSVEVCPRNESHLHIYVRDSYMPNTSDMLAKELNSIIIDEINKSFNISIDLINKIRKYGFN